MISVGTAKVDTKKMKEKKAGGSGTVDVAANPEAVSISSSGVARKSSQTKKQVSQVITTKTVEFAEARVVRVNLLIFGCLLFLLMIVGR